MFKIAICDDEKIVCTQLERIVAKLNPQYNNRLDVEIFYSGEDLCAYMEKGHYFDLIFLDIEMHEINGVEVGKRLREKFNNQTTQIVYVSCRETYYRALFEVRPQNFINKPITEEGIKTEISKAITLSGKLGGIFTCRIGRDTLKIPYRDILWLESDNRKVRLIKTTGAETFYGNLDTLSAELTTQRFMRIHRAFLANYLHVSRFKYTELVMSNNAILPISKSNQKFIRELQTKWANEEV